MLSKKSCFYLQLDEELPANIESEDERAEDIGGGIATQQL